MNLSPYQLIVPLVAIIAIIYAWNLTMRQKKSIWEAFLWTVFWGIIALIAIEPGLLSYLTVVTGIKSQVNAIITTSLGILFFLLFSLVVRMEELEQRLTRVVREAALKEWETKEAKETNETKERL
jgi:hypothetical protein